MVKHRKRRRVCGDKPFTSALASGLTGLGAGSATAPPARARSMKDRLVVMRIVMGRGV